MSRKRVTEVFPFLLPLRIWQRKKLFYLKMQSDENQYAVRTSETVFKNPVFEAFSRMLNEKSGFDMKYQINKVHNLKLAAKTINHIVIRPNETFSFWQLVRWADRDEKYKDGLDFVNGKIVGSYGGGLCQLSNLLFWMFLHTPLTIVERHGHAAEAFPAAEDFPYGVDATINEGWLDLKVRNDTDNTFQIEISFDDAFIYGRILSEYPAEIHYSVFNSSVSYFRKGTKIYQSAMVNRFEVNEKTGSEKETFLYRNQCEIGYSLPDNIKIEERGA